MSNIQLFDSHLPESAKITQLYEYLELYSYPSSEIESAALAHALFVMSRESLHQIENIAQLGALDNPTDRLLIVDPPEDMSERFVLEGDVAVLFTEHHSESDGGGEHSIDFPRVQTIAGGVAHLQIGDHFLDIYSQGSNNILHLPALGIICGGFFGSDVILPQVAPGSDGGTELDTLRLLARLVKERRLQLYIPRIGSLVSDTLEVMKRLAADVAYLHGLRRVVPTMAQRGDSDENLLEVAETLLPEERSSEQCHEIHTNNVLAIYEASL